MSTAGLPLASLDAVFLDAGNTIVGIDVDLVAERLSARGAAVPAAALARAEAAARPDVSERLAGGASSEARDTFAFYLARTLDRAAEALREPETVGIADRARRAELAAEVALELKTRVTTRRLWSRVLPGVPQALARLRALGLRVLVVSNSDGSIAQGLADMGLAEYFDGVVDSFVVGFEKPDPRIFRHALELAGTAPERTAHVGDLYAVDVVGARGAGVHGVLLDPFDDWGGVDCPRFSDVASLARAIAAARP